MNHFLWGLGRAGHWIAKIGNQSSDSQSSIEQANCKYHDQTSDLSKAVIDNDQRSRQLQEYTVARQALAATPQIIETAGRIGS